MAFPEFLFFLICWTWLALAIIKFIIQLSAVPLLVRRLREYLPGSASTLTYYLCALFGALVAAAISPYLLWVERQHFFYRPSSEDIDRAYLEGLVDAGRIRSGR